MDNGGTYRVKIFTPNCFIIFRGKKVRTPTECHNVFENELDVLKMQILRDSLKYSIIEESEIKNKVSDSTIFKRHLDDAKIEELYDPDIDSNSIMDRLIAEEKANKK